MTIIVIIIIATITIPLLTGEDGIIKNSQVAKETTEIREEKSVVNQSVTIAMGKDKFGYITQENLQNELDKYTGKGGTTVTDKSETGSLVVTFTYSKRTYDVDIESGKVNGLISTSGLKISYEPTIWTKENVKVKIEAEEEYKDEGYKIIYKYTPDEEWKEYTGIIEIEKNKAVYARLQKGDKVTAVASANVTNIDKSLPTITISPNGKEGTISSCSVTVTAADTGGSGLSSNNSYQYYLSTSSTTQTGGEWINYTSGTAFTIGNGLKGTYYLHVKSISDNAGNNSGVKVSGAFNFDSVGPTITLGSNSNTTYSKNGSVTVTIQDKDTGLASGAAIKYGWSTSTTTEPSSYTTASLNYTNGAKSTTFTASASGLTGQYYLWVVPTILKDVTGNSNTTTVKSTGKFYFDNSGPIVTFGKNGDTTWAKSQSTTVNVSDAHSGVSTRYYAWSTSSDTVPTFSSTFTNGSTISSSTSGKYYLWIKAVDVLGNTTTTKSNVFYVDSTPPTLGTHYIGVDASGHPYITGTIIDEHSGAGTYLMAYSKNDISGHTPVDTWVSSTSEKNWTVTDETIDMVNGISFDLRLYDAAGNYTFLGITMRWSGITASLPRVCSSNWIYYTGINSEGLYFYL